jgi:hypothetical protein
LFVCGVPRFVVITFSGRVIGWKHVGRLPWYVQHGLDGAAEF